MNFNLNKKLWSAKERRFVYWGSGPSSAPASEPEPSKSILMSLGGSVSKVFDQVARILEMAGDLTEKGVDVVEGSAEFVKDGIEAFKKWVKDPGQLNEGIPEYHTLPLMPKNVPRPNDPHLAKALKRHYYVLHLTDARERYLKFYAQARIDLAKIRDELEKRRQYASRFERRVRIIKKQISDNEALLLKSKFEDDESDINMKLASLRSELLLHEKMMSSKVPFPKASLVAAELIYGSGDYSNLRYVTSAPKNFVEIISTPEMIQIDLNDYLRKLLIYLIPLESKLKVLNTEIKRAAYWRDFELMSACYPYQMGVRQPPLNESKSEKKAREQLEKKNAEAVRKEYERLIPLLDYSPHATANKPIDEKVSTATPFDDVNSQRSKYRRKRKGSSPYDKYF